MGYESLLPQRVCYCCSFEWVRLLVAVISVLRVAGIVCGFFYGPYLYLVISLGGLYLAGKTFRDLCFWGLRCSLAKVKRLLKAKIS